MSDNFVKNTLKGIDLHQFDTVPSDDSDFRYIKFSPFKRENKDTKPNNRFIYPKPPGTSNGYANNSAHGNDRTGTNNGTYKGSAAFQSRQLNRTICSNCGIQGHFMLDCDHPVQSYGLVILDPSMDSVLLIQRKDSFGFISLVNNDSLKSQCVKDVIRTITVQERNHVVTQSFDKLWQMVINDFKLKKNRFVFDQCKQRFNSYQIKDIARNTDESVLNRETDWGFPKGRIKKREKWIECAKREACEETNLNEADVEIISSIPLMENIKGSDGKTYINVYYIAMVKPDKMASISLSPQKTEIRQLKFCNVAQLDQMFHKQYETDCSSKKRLVHQITTFIRSYRNRVIESTTTPEEDGIPTKAV